MPRRPRLVLSGYPLHVVQRGINGMRCFRGDRDRRFYLARLRADSREHAIEVHAYVLMSNHVHLLLTPREPARLGLMMKSLGQRYAQYFNWRHDRSGTPWDGRYFSCLVQAESYLFSCHRYIECNPVRAGMVSRPEDFRWSSFRANAFGAWDPLITRHPVIEALATDPVERCRAYCRMFETPLDAGAIQLIRQTTIAGHALGNDMFARSVEAVVNRRARRGRPGRPKTPSQVPETVEEK